MSVHAHPSHCFKLVLFLISRRRRGEGKGGEGEKNKKEEKEKEQEEEERSDRRRRTIYCIAAFNSSLFFSTLTDESSIA